MSLGFESLSCQFTPKLAEVTRKHSTSGNKDIKAEDINFLFFKRVLRAVNTSLCLKSLAFLFRLKDISKDLSPYITKKGKNKPTEKEGKLTETYLKPEYEVRDRREN